MASIVFCFTCLVATFGVPRRGYLRADAPNTLASGTKLYVRLEAAVSTQTSHLGQAVTARVVREVPSDQGDFVPIGAEVTGKIAKLIPTSAPTDHAYLLIHFTQLAISGHPAMDLSAHLTEVENARETVLADGTIQGVLEKDAAVGRMDGLLDKLGSAGSEMERMSNKALGKADTSIDYPAGTDMILTLDQPLAVGFASSPAAAAQISAPLLEAVQKMLADAPNRAESKAKKPGDPLNLVIIGSADQILNAYQQAGWSEAKKLGTKSAIGTVRAMASDAGYEEAPVSQLYLFGRPEDFAFEKMLNTFLKRHHLRLWQTAVTTPDGREIWLGASTHDIGLDVHPGVVSHAIDPDLDAERSKVGADLMAGGQVAAEQLVTRPDPLSEGKTATGGTWKTDGCMLVIELNSSGAM
ncbi:MAG: LssY C-terminal domain-containing protein [Terriglobia bacterium]